MNQLTGKNILVVEDEALIAAMIEDMIRELGATVVGPASTIARGLALAQSEAIDAALLDVNVRDEHIQPIADALKGRGIPMLFATGYGSGAFVDDRTSVIDKPFTQETLAKALSEVLRTGGERGKTEVG